MPNFLDITDLVRVIHPDELTEITRGDTTLSYQAIDSAVEQMKVYLNDSYNVDAIFQANGGDRNALLVQYGCDIAVYFIVSRNMAGQDADDRRDRFDRAIQWLKMAMKSETYSSLPRRSPTAQKHIGFGSQPKRTNYF